MKGLGTLLLDALFFILQIRDDKFIRSWLLIFAGMGITLFGWLTLLGDPKNRGIGIGVFTFGLLLLTVELLRWWLHEKKRKLPRPRNADSS